MRGFRTAIGVLGELLITAGLIILLYVVWTLYVVGAIESGKQAETVIALEKSFATQGATAAPEGPDDQSVTVEPSGNAFAIIRIPRLGGSGWAKPVYEGVDLGVLAQGLGRYPGTAEPGRVGNLAIAGHRSGHGNPLLDIERIQPGDFMVIQTRKGFYVYQVDRYEIVPPTSVDVIAPAPQQPGVEPTEKWFTLTTCDPKYGNANRYVVFSKYVKYYRPGALPERFLADPNGEG